MAYSPYYPDTMCPTCQGRRYEPSPITTFRQWCRTCEGAGRFTGGRPAHPIQFSDFIRAERSALLMPGSSGR